MDVLVIYATTEGQTRKVAHFVAETIEKAGHSVTLVDAADVTEKFELPSADLVIVAASLHLGCYQAAIIHLIKQHRAALAAVPTAFLSVSLAAAGDDDDLKGLADCVEKFERETEWKPGTVEHVAGAFRFTQYDFFKRWALKFIALRRGEPSDTSQDYEYTDWEKLAEFVDRFMRRATG